MSSGTVALGQTSWGEDWVRRFWFPTFWEHLWSLSYWLWQEGSMAKQWPVSLVIGVWKQSTSALQPGFCVSFSCLFLLLSSHCPILCSQVLGFVFCSLGSWSKGPPVLESSDKCKFNSTEICETSAWEAGKQAGKSTEAVLKSYAWTVLRFLSFLWTVTH